MRKYFVCFIAVMFVSLASNAFGSELFTPSYLPYLLKTASGEEMTWDATFAKVEPVQVDVNALFRPGVHFQAKSNFANEVSFQVEGITHNASLSDFEYRNDESYSWFGRVAGSDFLSHFAVLNGKIAGEIWLPTTTPGGFHRSILYRGGGQFLVQWNEGEVNKGLANCQIVSKLTEESAVASAQTRLHPVRPGPCGPGEVQFEQVDIGGVYDETAIEWYGVTTNTAPDVITLSAQSFVDYANATIQNSKGGDRRINLVGMNKVNYRSAGDMGADVTWAYFSPEVEAFRGQADLMFIMVGVTSYAFGVALGFSEQESMFAMVAKGGSLTFTHELGHELGMHHQPSASSPDPRYAFAFDHLVNGRFSGAVASPNATDCPINCPLIPVYPNPSVLFEGIPTGIPDERENWRMLAIAFPIVSEYRSGSRTTCKKKFS